MHQGPEGWDFSTQLTDLITLDSPEEARSYVMEALAKGRDLGIAEGREALAGVVIQLLTLRFPPVADDVRQRVRAADLATLQTWHRQAIVAPDLESVFKPVSSPLKTSRPAQPVTLRAALGEVDEALAKGRDQGQREELAAAVIQILTVRFRSVPADVCERVRAGDLATLRTWHVRAVVAPHLESVFKPESSAPRLRAAPEQADAEATLAKGREALAAAIIQILAVRFRSVPADVCERVLAADLASLQIWFGKAACAPDLESVFKPASSPPEGGSRDA